MSAIEWGVLVFKNGIYQPQVSGLATELSFGAHNYNDLEPNAVTLYIDRNYLRVGFLGYEKYKLFHNATQLYEKDKPTVYDTATFHKSARFEVGSITDFHLKYLGKRNDGYWLQGKPANSFQATYFLQRCESNINVLTFSVCGDRFTVIYGFAIDTKAKAWNMIKRDWLGKKMAQKVDDYICRAIWSTNGVFYHSEYICHFNDFGDIETADMQDIIGHGFERGFENEPSNKQNQKQTQKLWKHSN